MNVGWIVVFHFLQWNPIFRCTLSSNPLHTLQGLGIKYVMNRDALHSPSAKALSNVFLLGINLRAYIFGSFPFGYDYALHITIDWNEQKGKIESNNFN